MATLKSELTEEWTTFIQKQKIFFVSTATADSSINISPKTTSELRVLGPKQIVWLNLTGSGNETACHVRIQPRMTIMFVSFETKPLILRVYAKAKVIHPTDDKWRQYYSHFEPNNTARQIFDLAIERVNGSCGFAIPYYEYVGERDTLNKWGTNKTQEDITQYWLKRNERSIDDIPTHIAEGIVKSE